MPDNQNTQGQNDGLENQGNQADESALNQAGATEAAAGEASPAPQEDVSSRFAALEAQLAREKERAALLERSLSIQERFQQQQHAQPQHQAPAPKEEAWSNELDVLDKALDPLLKKRFSQVVDPLHRNYGAIIEDNDALRFEMFLQRNNPDVLEDEEAYNRTVQQVEAIRQAAAQRGMNVSRVDAFVFNEGLQGTRAKITQRKQKRVTAGQAETRRVAEVNAAQQTSTQGAPRAAANAGIQAIRDKANRGERLSPEERVKLRDFVSSVQF